MAAAAIWPTVHPAPPWVARRYQDLPWAPAWTALGITVLYLLVMAAYSTLTGADFGQPQQFVWIPTWWSELVNGLMLGLAPAVLVYLLRSSEQEIRELQPALGCDDVELEALVRDATRLNRNALRLGGALSVCWAFWFSFFDPGLWETRPRPPANDPLLLWMTARHLLIGWLGARTLLADLMIARAFARLADRVQHVDLLDLKPLTPFTRRSMKSFMFWMLGLALFSLFWLSPNAGQQNIVTFLILVGVPASILFIIQSAIHRRIRREKEDQLDVIRDQIRAQQRALLEPDTNAAADAGARLPALLASEERIATAREWPFDTSSVLRIGLYVMLGVGSWVGGALVERLLGVALD